MNDLIILENINLPMAFANGQVDPLIAEIEKQARSFFADISTPQGRKDVASMAYKIAQSKTLLDKAGKELASEWKEKSKKIDAERSRIWDRLEVLQKDVRAPLTAWEDADKERIAGHEAALADMAAQDAIPNDAPSAEIERRIARLIEISGSRSWEEFTARAKDSHKLLYDSLLLKAERRRQWEVNQIELERLRKEEVERKQKGHEERIAAEAAEKARLAAEEKARMEAEAEAIRVKAEQDKAERETREANARAEKAEADKKAAEEKAEMERLAAEGRLKLAEEKAKKDAEAAAQREREKIEADKRAEAQATAVREANKQHRAKINNEAIQAIFTAISKHHIGNSDEIERFCKTIIEAIAKGEIPNVSIRY